MAFPTPPVESTPLFNVVVVGDNAYKITIGETILQGPPGVTGAPGSDGAPGIDGVDGQDGAQGIQGETGSQGIQGIQGNAGANGQGIPAGGTADQLIKKVDGTDYNTAFVTYPLPANIVTKDANSTIVGNLTVTGQLKTDGAGADVVFADRQNAHLSLFYRDDDISRLGGHNRAGGFNYPLIVDGDALSGAIEIVQSGDIKLGHYTTLGYLKNDATGAVTSKTLAQVKSDLDITDAGEQNYVGTFTWTGGTAPSSTLTAVYHWSRCNKLITLCINFKYAVAGATLTNVTLTLPADCPAPVAPTGFSAANTNNYMAQAGLMTTINGSISSSAVRGALRVNAGANGWIIDIPFTSMATISGLVTVQYYTA